MAFVLLGLAAHAGPLPGDQALASMLHGAMGTAAGSGLAVVSTLVDSTRFYPAQLVLAAVFWWARLRRAAVALVLGAGVEIAVWAAKILFGRLRPAFPDPGDLVSDASFPSGHTARVASTAAILVILVAWPRRRWRLPAAIVAATAVLLIALARVSLGVHWPSDVIGGALAGTLWAAAVVYGSGRLVSGSDDERR